ncbi:MAG: BREX-1 system adenine-specific DNA-methyltransferase PglX, partial [Planctomycetota bacterium]|nr:BREX-1 system adenine-specific DNA-methyltransferase PglX [Planctomycetota bacterium]
RDLKILDPACGSGHFLLYCSDLLLTIYEEAYADPDLGPALKQDYPKLEDLRRDVPRLILAHNLHGIDIDLRASQIAALALWLRCQRAYQEMGLKKDRPQITRSNFVCAEPMPGEEQMLKEFVGQLEPKVLGQVVEVVFDKMKLAGEAGSLLKIEEEIRDAILEAKRQYAIGGISVQRTLFDKPSEPVVKVFSVKDISDAQFFEGAEAQVIEALRSYAEKAQNGQRLQRRLFSDDAVRGFAFVDICQKRYDVLLMNPPFGKPSTRSLKLFKKTYPNNWKDLYAAFFERALLLAPSGMIGAITSSQFLYTKQMRQLRQQFVDERALRVFLKLGHEVLDGAAVDTGLSVLSTRGDVDGAVAYGDLSGHAVGERAKQLSAIRDLISSTRFLLQDFRHIATTPFAFHSCPVLLKLWNKAERLQPTLARVATGNHTFDEERFIRLRWEVPMEQLDERWKSFEKGGEYQPFFAGSPLVLDWKDDGKELRHLNVTKHGSDAQVMQSSKYWYRSGLCYSHVSSVGFGPRVLPKNAIFSSESIAVISKSGADRLPLLGLLCSTICQELVNVFGEYRKIENRAVSNLPLSAEIVNREREALAGCAEEGVRNLRQLESLDETSPLFWAPDCIVTGECGSLSLRDEIHQRMAKLYERLDEVAENALQVPHGKAVLRSRRRSELTRVFVYRSARSVKSTAHGLVSFCLGVSVGRWKPCVPGRDDPDRDTSSPFAAIPLIPPAAMRTDHVPNLPQSGILVDDSENPHDVLASLRSVIEWSWKDRLEECEESACENLGVKELRDYFRKPGKGGFWDDHISRYSKSRRKAPIYWLLQSSKKNYALWLYYHRLDKDLLFKALVNYVEPKIRLETSRLESLRSQKAAAGESGKEAKRFAKDVERQEDFLSELRDFEDKLRRAANLHLEPDLNDGVVLNIAPLRELVPWKVAKEYWDELLAGKYEWSNIGKQLREKGLVK